MPYPVKRPNLALVKSARAEAVGTTRERLLRVAERLFATEGIDAVSMRRICAEAGQRNKTALQYHFGSKENLVEAILADRMTAINARRQAMLDEIVAEGRGGDLRGLVAAVVVPFAEQMSDASGGRHYVRFVARLFSRGDAVALLGDRRPWTKILHDIVAMIREHLTGIPDDVVVERLSLMAGQLVHATAAKEYELEGIGPRQRKLGIENFCRDLVDYVVGGLTAPVSRRAARSRR